MPTESPLFIQLKNAAGNEIFPRVDLANVQGELAMDKVAGLSDAVAELDDKANASDVYNKTEVYTQTEAKGLFVMYDELPE